MNANRHRLINEFCDGISKWAEITKNDPIDVVFHAIMHLGAAWFVKAEGAMENPKLNKDPRLTVGQVYETYTVEQLKNYLIHLVDDYKILEDFTIIGLAYSIQYELNGYVITYDKSLQGIRERAEFVQDIIDHPDKNQETLNLIKDALTRKGTSQDTEHTLLSYANFMWKMSHRPEDTLAQHKSRLVAWNSIIEPIISRENIEQSRDEYFQDLGLIQKDE